MNSVTFIPLHKFTCWLCEQEFYGSSSEVNSCDECFQIGLDFYSGKLNAEPMDIDEPLGEFEDIDYEGPIYPE